MRVRLLTKEHASMVESFDKIASKEGYVTGGPLLPYLLNEDGNALVFGVFEGEAITGYCCVKTGGGFPFGANSVLTGVMIEPSLRGKGYGSELIERVLKAEKVKFPVMLSYVNSQSRFYEKFGFVDQGDYIAGVIGSMTLNSREEFLDAIKKVKELEEERDCER